MLDKISRHSVVIEKSKNGMLIPVVNGAYLHSVYNPAKEARGLVEKHKKTIRKKNIFLVFGLGFGYHINELSRELKKRHSQNYGILVIEPNTTVFNECSKRKMLTDISQIEVFSGADVGELYKSKSLISFMMSKPAILAHPPSFNLYLDYYQSFMNYRAATGIKSVALGVNDKKIRERLMEHDGDPSILGMFQEIKKKPSLNPEDMILGSFFAICEMDKVHC